MTRLESNAKAVHKLHDHIQAVMKTKPIIEPEGEPVKITWFDKFKFNVVFSALRMKRFIIRLFAKRNK